jgi:Na+/H+ antiporter NhaA
MVAAAAPKTIASLPKTASYLALIAVMGLLGIGFGTLLRILALQLERR